MAQNGQPPPNTRLAKFITWVEQTHWLVFVAAGIILVVIGVAAGWDIRYLTKENYAEMNIRWFLFIVGVCCGLWVIIVTMLVKAVAADRHDKQ